MKPTPPFGSARLFSANEALAMGLVKRVIPTNILESYILDYCQTIAQNAPLTLRAVKKIVAQIIDHDHPTEQNVLIVRTISKVGGRLWKNVSQCLTTPNP